MSREAMEKAIDKMALSIVGKMIESAPDENVKPAPGSKKDFRLLFEMPKPSGNEAFDEIHREIWEHQIKGISLRSISLNRRLYDIYFEALNRNMMKATNGQRDFNREAYYNGDCKFVAYQVDIVRGNMFQIKATYCERYYEERGQKDAYFGPKFGAKKK